MSVEYKEEVGGREGKGRMGRRRRWRGREAR